MRTDRPKRSSKPNEVDYVFWKFTLPSLESCPTALCGIDRTSGTSQPERRGVFSLVGSLENFRLLCRTASYNSCNSHFFGDFQAKSVNKTSLISNSTQLVRESFEIGQCKMSRVALYFSVEYFATFAPLPSSTPRPLTVSLTDAGESIIEQTLLERLKALDHFRPILPSFAQSSHFVLNFSDSSPV